MTNPKPREVILGNFKNAEVMTPPDLGRAMACLTAVSNIELLDSSFFEDRCYATLHASAIQRFLRAVRQGVLDVAVSLAESDKVVVLADFDEFSRDDPSPTEDNNYSTPEEVLRLPGRKRLRCLPMLSNRISPRNLPEYVKQAW